MFIQQTFTERLYVTKRPISVFTTPAFLTYRHLRPVPLRSWTAVKLALTPVFRSPGTAHTLKRGGMHDRTRED